MSALTFDGVTKVFPRVGTVLNAMNLQVRRGEMFSIVGPSGCGKSTALRIIAGFDAPTAGRILIDGRDATGVPPNQREVGFVFQSYALFPHLSVAQNVAFGLEARRVPRAERAVRTAEALESVQLANLAAARVDQLSGGQQQRVALARALVTRPALLLLDEPLSNLDAGLRAATRAALCALQQASGITAIHVTHDQSDALAMSDRIAVLRDGRVEQVGTPEEIYERPATRFVATFIGRTNVLEATIARTGERGLVAHLDEGTDLALDEVHHASSAVESGTRVALCLREESLHFADKGPFAGVVTQLEFAGATTRYVVTTRVGDLRVSAPSAQRRPRLAERVHIAVSPSAGHVIHATA